MQVLNTLGGLATTLVALAFLALQTWFVAATVRRVLGVRVGWPRTFIVSAVVMSSLATVVQWMFEAGFLPLDQSHVGGVMAYLALIVLWSFAIASAVIVGLEMIVPTGAVPPLRRLLFGWRERLRRGHRYVSVLSIAARHGLGSLVRGFVGRQTSADARTAESLRLALNEAGVAFVKLGQMLSTRADLLPAAYVRELSLLQNKAEPETWDTLRAELERNLGYPISEVFADVDETPLASASVAQVHAATLLDGSAVVVKVQRPGAEAQVNVDLDIMSRLARTWNRNSAEARAFGVIGLVEGFADSLREELDYRVEVENMAALRTSLDRRGVRIPHVYPQYSGQRLIVMERFDGTPVSDASVLLDGLAPVVREATASRLLEAVLGQIIGDGVFHADLHPGNVVLWPSGETGLLDFGSVGRIDALTRRNLGLLLWAIDADDPVLATDALVALLDRPEGLDERRLQRSLGTLVTRFRNGLGAGGSIAVFTELFGLIIHHGFTVPPQLAAALRSLGALEGTLVLVDPSLDLVSAARGAGKDSLGDLSASRIKDEVMHRAVSLLPIIDQLPRRLSKITEDLEQGRTTLHVRMISDPDDRAFVRGLVHQVVVAILAGSAVLGGIMLFVSPGGAQLVPGVSWFSFLGALLVFAGFMLALRAVAMIFGRSPDL